MATALENQRRTEADLKLASAVLRTLEEFVTDDLGNRSYVQDLGSLGYGNLFFEINNELIAFEIGLLREAREGEIRQKILSAIDRTHVEFDGAQYGGQQRHLIAVIGSGLGEIGHRELMDSAYYIDVPRSHWAKDLKERAGDIMGFLSDSIGTFVDEPEALEPAKARDGANPDEYKVLPFEVDPELVKNWVKRLGMSDKSAD